jgi:hypothetical protein
MSRWAMVSLMAATVALAAIAQGPHLSRNAIQAMERSFDKRVLTANAESPFDLLGTTRGVYLNGYGAVFTTELSLMVTANVSPFLQTIPKDYVTKVHTQKLQRLAVLKRMLQDAMVATAASLDNVPTQENIVFGVSLFYYKWEDTAGLPSRILMQAERQKLLDVQLGRASRSSVDAIIHVQEL